MFLIMTKLVKKYYCFTTIFILFSLFMLAKVYFEYHKITTNQEIIDSPQEKCLRNFLQTSTRATLFSGAAFMLLVFFLLKKVRRDEVTYKKQLEEKVSQQNTELRDQVHLLKEYKKVLDLCAIVSKGDLDGNITYVNNKLCQDSGYRREELIGKPHSIFRHPDVPAAVFEKMWNTIQAKQHWQGTLPNRLRDGSTVWNTVTICPVLNIEGKIIEYIGARVNVTELVEKREQLKQALTIDSLTGLPNRAQLLYHLNSMERPTLILLDIHNFSSLNDFYGIEEGDTLIRVFAERVDAFCRNKPFTVYRYHGDCLALLHSDSGTRPFIDFFCHDLIDELTVKPYLLDRHEIPLNITVGVSFALDHPEVEADIALKQAQERKKELYILEESKNLKRELASNLACASRLRTALHENRIVVYCQPIVRARDGQVDKYECLVRIRNPDGTIVGPANFLEIAKKSRIYTKITRSVIQLSCAMFQGLDYDFSINLSTEDILDPAVSECLKNTLLKYDLQDKAILEIIETEGFENYEQVAVFIEEMKVLGCRIAIDDFGTGHSNYERLMKLQVDYLKIDGSIIRRITNDQIHRAITKTIVEVAQQIGVKTVAEFVADEEIAAAARELGVDYLQGYYFGAPQRRPI